jgi:ubiquinone/menaquinone biosynthesis C-methylase UbiE
MTSTRRYSYGDVVAKTSSRADRRQRYWDKQADTYDQRMSYAERRIFADTRQWLCGQAVGDTLEVAIGTGLNLEHYPDHIRLTAIEFSPKMLAVAQRRAQELGRSVELRVGDAQSLEFPDGSFDTVVCTFALCGIPGERLALEEMAGVLRPGGALLLADHVASSSWAVRALQWLVDRVTVPLEGEHYGRRPLPLVESMGLRLERHDRFKLGIIERLAARKPAS